jgi:DNA-binding CsgD family transcriptional regulator
MLIYDRMTAASNSAKAIKEHFVRKDEVRRWTERNPEVPKRLEEIARWLDADLRAAGLAFEIKTADATPGEAWAKRYGLTPAETRLATHLLAGGTTETYARDRGVSPHTVRNQLRAIYAKTDTNRQVSLLQLLLRASGKNP